MKLSRARKGVLIVSDNKSKPQLNVDPSVKANWKSASFKMN